MAVTKAMGCLTIFAILLILSSLIEINKIGSKNNFLKDDIACLNRMGIDFCNTEIQSNRKQ